MKKILLMVVGILLVIGLVAGGTIAYFSDTEETTQNVIQAGTIDLALSVDEVVSGTFIFLDIKPCEDLDPMVIKLENVGQNNGYLYQRITYIGEDKPEEHLPDLTADEFAALIYVKSIMYQHFALGYPEGGNPKDDLPDMITAMDSNSDGYVSLYELKNFGWMPYDAAGEEDPDPEHTLKAGEAGTWTIVFHMADSLDGHNWGSGEPVEILQFDVLDNGPQADGIKITWTAILSQNPTFGTLP